MLTRVVEVELESAIEARNEALATLRELGPPDLVHLTRQSNKSASKLVRKMSEDMNSGLTVARRASTIMLPAMTPPHRRV
jgi:hypothetical protein